MTRHQKTRRRTKGATALHETSASVSCTALTNSLPSSPPALAAEHLTRNSVAACTVYAVASLTIVFLNRSILTKRFPFPLTLTWIQEIVGATLYTVLSSIGKAASDAHLADAALSSPSSTPVAPKLHGSTRESQSRHIVPRLQSYGNRGSWCGTRWGAGLALWRSWLAHSLSFLLPVIPLHLEAMRRLLPASVALVGTVTLGNACLQRVQVSTYQVARSLTLLITLVLQKLFLGIDVSLGAAVSCGVVCFGFFIGSLDTTTLSLSGALTGSLASLSQAMYTALTRQALDRLKGGEAAAMYYNMVNASLLLPPLIWASGEAQPLLAHLSGSLSQQNWKNEVNVSGDAEQHNPLTNALGVDILLKGRNVLEVTVLLVVSGALAFILTISSSWIISLTSPVTFGVLGCAKACAQTILGFLIFTEKCTLRSLTGVALTIGGSAAFLMCKHRDARGKHTSPCNHEHLRSKDSSIKGVLFAKS